MITRLLGCDNGTTEANIYHITEDINDHLTTGLR